MSASDATEEAEMQPLNPSGASGASGAATDSGVEEKGCSTPSPDAAEMPIVAVRPTRQRVGFLMEEDEDDEHSELRKKVKREFAKMNGRSSHERLQQQRMSLLGKPLAYRQSKRDAKFRKVQTRIYNFLERPAGWFAIIYHILVFLLLFLCLIISILATVDTSFTKSSSGEIIRSSIYITCNHLVFSMELVIVLTLTIECVLRIWSAGCRSRYQGHYGRLRFIRRPLCILDIVVVFASVLIIAVGTKNAKFMEPAFRGLRFLQILRMVRLDRRGSTWKLLGSVVWAHRQELLTTWYIGFLALISISFMVYTLEHEINPKDYATLPDALWYGLVTLTTVGYGDKTPESWAGKLSAAILAVLGVSFFALPAGILGSGFALQVQQQQRQKHFARRRHPAAMLIQCLWRCYAADPNSCSMATWKPHLKPVQSPTNNNVQARSNRHSSFRTNNLISRLSIKRSTNSPMLHRNSDRVKKGVNGIYDDDEKKMELSTGDRYGEQDSIRSRGSHRYHNQHAQETVGLTKLTEAHKNAIRAVRKIKYFVARRKFKEAFRPYDVKDVIEQYSSGHADMLARIKSLQARLDNILGKPGQPDRRVKGRGGGDLELFDPSISLLSRVVKVERRVTLIDRKLDMLIELYREERHGKMQESRSEEKDDSHESELDMAPKGFRRRGWSSGAPRPRDATGQRHESTDTSSATSPADITGTGVVAHKLKSSDPSLVEDEAQEADVTISSCLPPDAQAQSGDTAGAKTRLGTLARDSVDEVPTKEDAASQQAEPKKLSRRWKRPGAVRIRPARSAESVNCPPSGDSVSYSSGRQSSMGSLAPADGETRI